MRLWKIVGDAGTMTEAEAPNRARSMLAALRDGGDADAGAPGEALFETVDVRALLLDPVDLRGIPWRDGADRTRWAPPAFLPPSDDPGRWLINLEELPSAVPMVQAALYQLVLDRKVGEYELPEGASLIACGTGLGIWPVCHFLHTRHAMAVWIPAGMAEDTVFRQPALVQLSPDQPRAGMFAAPVHGVVLAEPVGQHTTCRSGADDDVIEFGMIGHDWSAPRLRGGRLYFAGPGGNKATSWSRRSWYAACR